MQLLPRIKPSKEKAVGTLASLLREKGRDILVFAFFLAISFGFWMLQKLNDTFEADLRVPIELVGLPKGVVITSPLPDEVVVTVKDRGTNIFNYRRSSRGITPIRVDFSAYDNGDVTGKASVAATDIQRVFLQQMNSSLQVVRMRPGKFEFCYNRGAARRIPVQFVGSVTTGNQNYLQGITVSPDSVLVYAPPSVLDTLRYAYTLRHDVAGITKSTAFDLGFTRPSGVMMVPETVKVTAHVDYYMEQTVKVPVIGLNFPAGMSLKTFPAMVTVKYRVGAANARLIKPENFVLAVTYEEIMANRHQKYTLQPKSVPVGVSHVRILPQEVDYLLEYSTGDAPMLNE